MNLGLKVGSLCVDSWDFGAKGRCRIMSASKQKEKRRSRHVEVLINAAAIRNPTGIE